MSFDDIAIRVENLGKRYVIGREAPPAATFGARVRQALASPFSWLTSQVRGPSDEEILWALRDVSFEVKRGEVLGVIGRNGAGKSTLLKVLSRITEPTTGHAEMHGRIGALLEVGTGMHPELTGRENIYLNGTIIGMRKAEIDSKFDEIVDFSGIGRFLDTPVKRYSSGMRVRLGFTIAAHLEPEILIVDEVLAVGDAEFQKKCLGKMKDVAGHGRTVLFVSHNMAAVTQLCDRAMFLKDGCKAMVGEVDDAIASYLSSSTRASRTSIVKWGGNEDSPLRIRELEVHSPKGRSGALHLDISEDILFSMTYEVTRELRGVHLAVKVCRLGQVIAMSWDTDFATSECVRDVGVYRSSIKVPKFFLKKGLYEVLVAAGQANIGILDSPEEGLVFEVDEFLTYTSMKSFAAVRPGIVVGGFAWQTERVR